MFLMREKILQMGLLLVLAALLGFPMDLAASSVGRVVKVGTYQNRPGVFKDKKERLRGFYIDLVEYVAEQEGWTVEYVHGTWSQGLTRLRTGNLDLLVAVVYSSARDKWYDFTNETALSNWGQVYVIDSDIDSIPKLQNSIIAAVKGDTYSRGFQAILKEFGIQYQLLEVPSYDDVLQAVEDDDADAGIISRSSGMVFEKDYGVYKSSIICCASEVGFATRDGKNKELLRALDHHLKELKADSGSFYYESFNRWFGGDKKMMGFPKWLIWVLAGGAGLLVTMFIGNVFLQRQVRSRTNELEKEIGVRKKAEQGMRKAMRNLLTIEVSPGVFWLQIPEAELYILCGCPAEVVKHLMRKGFVSKASKDGVPFETGPNVVLLSDLLIQNGGFSNLSEFPVLQMLYRQGMMIPGHPNNTGVKPMLIGSASQVKAQMDYIYRGNYGLTSKEEIMAAGVDAETAEYMMRIKLKFAFGAIRSPADFLDTLNVGKDEVEIRNGVTVARLECNRYRFSYHGESTEIDLNLAPGVTYEPPYPLDHHMVESSHFAILHTGEGDGWDVNRPSMGSVVMYKGKIFLIDANPSVLHALIALGIGISEVEGIFHTHAHDDHFAGLPALIQSDRRLKYYSTPLVRASVVKKFSALMSLPEEKFAQFFEIVDLREDFWNNFDGLEVKPVYSPHPLENHMFLFRAKDKRGYHTYAHWADLSAMDVLDWMTGDSDDKVPANFMNKVKHDYFFPADLKKLDIGGGMIHGFAKDFQDDPSKRLILANIDRKLTIQEMEIGSESSFGAVDELIPSDDNFLVQRAFELFREFFPEIDDKEILEVLDGPILERNAGTIFRQSRGDHGDLDMILSGTVAYLETAASVRNHLSFGSLIGGSAVFGDYHKNEWTYRTVSHCRIMRFSTPKMRKFFVDNNLLKHMKEVMSKVWFLRHTWLFGEETTFISLGQIAKAMEPRQLKAGESVATDATPTLWVLVSGEVELCHSNGQVIEVIHQGNFFGEDSFLNNTEIVWNHHVTKETELYRFQLSNLLDFPIVHWKMLEVSAKRRRLHSELIKKSAS